MTDFSGQDIGRYRIIAPLEQGGMATVYRAYDTHLECEVAVKFIRMDQVTPAEVNMTLKRFEREAKEIARLTHPNIVKVTDYGDYKGTPFLVMPFLPGGSLRELTGMPMPYERAVKLLAPAARALEYAHEKNLIHRDIKPGNILLTDRNQPMVSDFGIAKILGQESGNTLTNTNMAIGTPEYMAPEQWLNQVSAQSDIYSLGVVFFELVTGRKPYTADTPAGVFLKQSTEPLPRAGSLVPGLPDAVEKVLVKALEKKPEDRYASMADFATALEDLIAPAKSLHLDMGLLTPDIHTSEAPSVNLITPPGEEDILTNPETPPEIPAPSPVPQLPPPDAPQGMSVILMPLVDTPDEAKQAVNSPSGRPAPKPPEKKRRKRSKWWLVGLVVLLVILAIGVVTVAAIFLSRPVPPAPVSPTRVPAAATTPGAVQLALTALAATPDKVANGAQEQLKIAVLARLSGSLSNFGVSTVEGALLAIKEWNAKGGVLGKQVQAIMGDGQCTADPAAVAANKVIDQDKVHYIVGEVCSGASIPVSEIANAKHVLQISGASTSPNVVRDANGQVKPYTFVACFNDDTQGKAMAKFAFETLKARNALILTNQTNDYAKSLATYFKQYFTAEGGKITDTETYAASDTDFSNILSIIALMKPDIVILPDYYNIVNLVTKQARQKGIMIPFIGGDGWESTDLDLVAADGGYFTTYYSPTENNAAVMKFVKSYGIAYQDDSGKSKVPDALAVLAYNATNILLQGIQNAGVDDPTKVKDTLARGTFETVSGTLTFDAFHTPIEPVVVMQVKNGKVEFNSLVMP